MTKAQRLHENIAAITAGVHQHKGYDAFYDRLSPTAGGFTGIWQLCISWAEMFTAVEGRLFWDGEYVDAIDAYVNALLAAEDVPSPHEQREFAVVAICEALTKHLPIYTVLPPKRLSDEYARIIARREKNRESLYKSK